MKNTFYKILFTFTLVLIPFISVSAKEIKTLNATESNGVIKVDGTAESGTLAVAIMVYDSTGTDLITMQTISVASDNSYADIINVTPGNYIVKVADYDGGNYITKAVSAADSNTIKIVTKENTTLNNYVKEEVTNLINKLVAGKTVNGISNDLKQALIDAVNNGSTITVDLKKDSIKESAISEDASKIKKLLGKNEKIAVILISQLL